MILDFAWLPPEVNSARIFAGAGSGPLFIAASAWMGLAADLRASAASFDSVVTRLATGQWSGPTSVSMAAAAAPFVCWLSGAAGEAELAAGQARVAATAFEAALSATVHPTAVTANRMRLLSLVATNFLAQNTPAIAATEFDYQEMWAQDVTAMAGYHAGAASVAATMTPFSPPPSNPGLAGLASQAASGVAAMVSSAAAPAQDVLATASNVVSGLDSLPLSSLSLLMYPLGLAMSPIMSLMSNAARTPTAGVASAVASEFPSEVPKLVTAPHAEITSLGGGGLGSAMSADLGNARMVGGMSVPPTWQGSMPAPMASSAMSGSGGAGIPTPAALTGEPSPAGMPMMPMPSGTGSAGAGMPGGMIGRGGASPNAPQSRSGVIPVTGIG
ncbi:PPE family protein [Mycobacterium simiae]|uniref:PPE family protein n=1 Tax=Mycobacterium simiae TaxID=1784 RepID=A0A5B1BVR8_MYCSI|nr:PPE family protein [Mycobacterium simiae]KAA1252101.1 PPE family protein [Mycobacterium simiae]